MLVLQRSNKEIGALRDELLCFCKDCGYPCSGIVRVHQPFPLEAWKSLALITCDPDAVLPDLLSEGVSTGIVDPIPASGVWGPVDCGEIDDTDLSVHLTPWGSAHADEELTWALLDKDIAAGHLFEVLGGVPVAKARWGNLVASGKLGVALAPGKKPRLIGDGTVSGTNPCSRIQEKVCIPGLGSVQQFLSRADVSQAFRALSFDVRGAHKLVVVKDAEQGLSCFAFGDRLFCYRTCYFGCKWAAYWFSRVGAFLVRHLHRWIYIGHGLWLYVDDGFVLLPAQVSPLLATCILMFLVAMGVPLSWEKVNLGGDLVWVGWRFCCTFRTAVLPSSKVDKISAKVRTLCVEGAKIRKKDLEKVLGMLVWIQEEPHGFVHGCRLCTIFFIVLTWCFAPCCRSNFTI